MEAAGYRETIARIRESFGNAELLTMGQTCEVMGLHPQTFRKYKPIPEIKVGKAKYYAVNSIALYLTKKR